MTLIEDEIVTEVLPSEPQQRLINKGLLNASAVFTELQRQHTKGAKWSTSLAPFYDPSQNSGLTVLVCKRCGSTLSASNPSDVASKHFPVISAAAVRLLSMHATTAAAERTWSSYGRTFTH
jgi:hypothetical protein